MEDMNEPSAEKAFEHWIILSLMGHKQVAGYASEQVIAGQSLLRLDVPQVNGQPAYTTYYGTAAIYELTPVSEEIARSALEYLRPRPVQPYLLPRPVREEIRPEEPEYYEDDEDDEDDDPRLNF
jgi:hypothetical protein